MLCKRARRGTPNVKRAPAAISGNVGEHACRSLMAFGNSHTQRNDSAATAPNIHGPTRYCEHKSSAGSLGYLPSGA